jgi:hypothetical protein
MVFELALRRYGEDRVFKDGNKTVIHFPEIQVTSTYNEKKTIYDGFLRFDLVWDTNNLRFKSDCYDIGYTMMFTRSTYEYVELESGYVHSHVYSMGRTYNAIEHNVCNFNRFCLRGNPLPSIFQAMREGDVEDKGPEFYVLKCFLEAEALLRTEDSPGVPTVRMNTCTGFMSLELKAKSIPLRWSNDRIFDLALDSDYTIKMTEDNINILKEIYPDFLGIYFNGSFGVPRVDSVLNLDEEVIKYNELASRKKLLLTDSRGEVKEFIGKVFQPEFRQIEINPDQKRFHPDSIMALNTTISQTVRNYHIKHILNERERQLAQDQNVSASGERQDIPEQQLPG